ncbi:MAG: hypothetical protein ACQET7_14960 [Thermodesulfobacteriota bacterium]
MIYYVYYDSYGDPRKAISSEELRKQYNNDPDTFLEAVRGRAPGTAHMTAHVCTLNFSSKRDLDEFLGSMNESNKGFFEGEGNSRPYNF